MNVRGRKRVDGDVKIIAISQPSTTIANHVVAVKYYFLNWSVPRFDIVEWYLKAGIFEREKTYVSMQRFRKQIAVVTDIISTIEELLASFLCCPCWNYIREVSRQFGNRYQATGVEDIADWGNLEGAVAIWSLWRRVKASLLFVEASSKLFTQTSVYSHKHATVIWRVRLYRQALPKTFPVDCCIGQCMLLWQDYHLGLYVCLAKSWKEWLKLDILTTWSLTIFCSNISSK